MKFVFLLFVLAIGGLTVVHGASPVIITEFMADNSSTLADEDGSYDDWIEIQNISAGTVNLDGWFLTDSQSDLARWRFPATNISAGAYLVVFASNKDRGVPGGNLHTNFKLSSSGDYLALVLPDGVTVATEFAPTYPPQFPDVSYGFSAQQTNFTLVPTNDPARILIPADGSLGLNWTLPGFNDSFWLPGTNGVGYDTGAVDPLESSYPGLVLESMPVGYWRLNETTGDVAANLGSLGGTADGHFQGSPVLGASGPVPPQFPRFEPDNYSPQFDGVDDFVAGPSGLMNDLPAFSMAGWIRPTGVQGNRIGLWGQNDVVEFGFINSTTIELWTPVGQIDITYPFPNNEWHHVAAVGTGQELELYFDGNLAATSPVTVTSYGNSTYAFNIGGGGVFDDVGNYFVGQIDEVSVWQRALSAGEIARLLQSAATPVDFSPCIATDVQSQMLGVSSSAYIRLPFNLADPAGIGRLFLRMKYDDGFVAWLNGVEVTRKNAPDTNLWNSAATARHSDDLAVQFEDFDISQSLGALAVGANVLAIQGLNIDATNTDFLIQARLDATSVGSLGAQARYFVTPTPGAPNGAGSADLGPILNGAGHSPAVPQSADNLLVTASVRPAFYPIASVALHYRVMFSAEVVVPMNDNGANGDTIAGDDIWSAVIPSSAFTNGQMIRYYIVATDSQGSPSRWPLFPDALNSEQYLGTVVADPTVQSALPVLLTFLENPGAADTRSGTRCSMFFLGEFYDNVNMSLHGQSSAGFPKKSYNLDFNDDHRFKYRAGESREKNLRLLSNWADKSKTHNPLAYEMIAA
ncbi:MAG TPA: LamG-like jellyroll fold domain-containing protein, partial [Candidatus Nitrosotalea sp.]|nr:LamG-like jellyroll fold domain-containing protein [Candidatus Nitrosotalea sp.]